LISKKRSKSKSQKIPPQFKKKVLGIGSNPQKGFRCLKVLPGLSAREKIWGRTTLSQIYLYWETLVFAFLQKAVANLSVSGIKLVRPQPQGTPFPDGRHGSRASLLF
jgi:hypothetical protein